MADLEGEKRVRRGNLRGNDSAVADVVTWRPPDIVFEDYLAIDLGDREVELWHFGPGNGPGDTVVYEPVSKVAWTGNYLMRAGIPTMLLEGGRGWARPTPGRRLLRACATGTVAAVLA